MGMVREGAYLSVSQHLEHLPEAAAADPFEDLVGGLEMGVRNGS
jgi:hypothetical protein